jgi:SpoVK/Ycf46/Vps4 family AAA+-type ATPase
VSGHALAYISQACSIARALQPTVVVIEDVDLIAEERESHLGENALLFQLLNEMDGIGPDADVTFLLTTNRADLLEEALAARPGRIDHAAELPVPDDDGRRQLIELYRGGLVLDLTDPEAVVRRTAGVTASFLNELLRRAALAAAERSAAPDSALGTGPLGTGPLGTGPLGTGPLGTGPLRVTDADMSAALDQLLDVRSQLTRALLGSHGARAADPP